MTKPKHGSRWLHVKSGHQYMVFLNATVEKTMEDAIVYNRWPMKEGDGRFWIRSLAEFMDGRFKEIEDAL